MFAIKTTPVADKNGLNTKVVSWSL